MAKVVLESAFAARVRYLPTNRAWWLLTANGPTNRRQIKLYSNRGRALAAARYWTHNKEQEYEILIVPVNVVAELPDAV